MVHIDIFCISVCIRLRNVWHLLVRYGCNAPHMGPNNIVECLVSLANMICCRIRENRDRKTRKIRVCECDTKEVS